MANELKYNGDPATETGLTVTARVYTNLFVQQGSDVSMSEVGSLAGYLGDMPAAAAGEYFVRFFNGATLLGTERLYWDGMNVIHPQLTNVRLTNLMALRR